jgi:hypothetical protein
MADQETCPLNPPDQHFACLPCVDIGRGLEPELSLVSGWCCYCGDWADAEDQCAYVMHSAPTDKHNGRGCEWLHEGSEE